LLNLANQCCRGRHGVVLDDTGVGEHLDIGGSPLALSRIYRLAGAQIAYPRERDGDPISRELSLLRARQLSPPNRDSRR
jgi:hypothetical protein